MERVCCVCHKVKNGVNWMRRPVRRGVLVSHGYCPVCAAKALEEIRRYNESHTDPPDKAVA